MWNATRLRLAAALVVLATVLALPAYWLRLEQNHDALRAQALQLSARHAEQMAAALADSQAGALANVDFALQGLRAEYLVAPGQVALHARQIIATFPAGMLRQIAVINADGYLTYSSLNDALHVYLGDRDHFKVHAISRTDQIYISKPVLGRVSQAWSIQFSRPMYRDGEFAGVMVFSIAPDFFINRFGALRLGPNDTLALLRSDGRFLARNRLQDKAMGQPFDFNAPFRGPSPAAHGSFRLTSTLDHVPRIHAWQLLEVFSLIAVVGFDERAVLAPVERTIAASREQSMVGSLLLAGCAAALALLLLRLARQQHALDESKARYSGLFENNAAIKLLVDPAGARIIDANPAAAEFYGYPREVLARMRLPQLISLPAEVLQREMERALSGESARFSCVHHLANGEQRQVEVYTGPGPLDGRNLLHCIVHDVSSRHELARRLRHSEEQLQALFDSVAMGVAVVDADGAVSAANPLARRLLGLDEAGWMRPERWLVHPDGTPLAADQAQGLAAVRDAAPLEHEQLGIASHGAGPQWLSLSARPLGGDDQGRAPAALLAFSDVSPLLAGQAAQRLAQSVFDAASEGIMVTDLDSVIVTVNHAFSLRSGYSADEIVGHTPAMLASGWHDEAFYRTLWQRLRQDGHWEGEINNCRKNGTVQAEWLKISVLADEQGRPSHYVALFSDICPERQRQQEAWQQAHCDALTGLPNRTLLLARTSRAMARAEAHGQRVALLYLDLERFQPIAARYGEEAGEQLLRQVGRRLENGLRPQDCVARLGSDEFAVLLADLPQDATAVAERVEPLLARLANPFMLGKHRVEIALRVGVAVFPSDGNEPAPLLARAELLSRSGAPGAPLLLTAGSPPGRGGLLADAEAAEDHPE
ncbi:sensor domain-containing diguanylate cyclase [Pseudogulbenkiania subflava]|uniref:PAS domain S-box-containing protein/diguanylate cyclase (GGDEF) domain-containing protein n=1 Tax=Pseudogulbenkiania subflava DSM 22618 TaxID=1123014 RepID=A0A1Y6BUT7_9NEIS|nr:diguanylate cyclase [Pseudogulbenkiania subflava]SMF29811.1 PAS domain S-box-containing protein/diguanylate cyclase (GGDEF) domain-containing protein [Pseudogulbenkiania subflava DSM 22618]